MVSTKSLYFEGEIDSPKILSRENKMLSLRSNCFLFSLLVLGVVVQSANAASHGTVIGFTQPATQTYQIDTDWTGSSTSGRLELGSCSYPLTGAVYAVTAHNLASQTVSETDLITTCGFSKTIDADNINIQGSVKFFVLSSTGDELDYSATAHIVYPLVARANSQVTISLLQSDDVGVYVVIPSELTLCGETTLDPSDPRLTTTVGSNLCFRHTINSTSSSQLYLASVEVELASSPITASVHSIVDSIASSGFVEYRVELTTGPCLTCQYTSTLYLTSVSPVSSRLARVIASNKASSTVVAKAGTGITVQTASSSDDHILSWKELEIVSITALVLAGLSFLLFVGGMLYHHCRSNPAVV
jgi:hypothetical protein